MKTISKELAKKVELKGHYDTKKYRYVWFGYTVPIFRYPIKYVRTPSELDWGKYEEVLVKD